MADIVVHLPMILNVMHPLALSVMVLPTERAYHYDLPERGPSGDMTGGEYWRYTNVGPFNSCTPTPTGEVGLGSQI